MRRLGVALITTSAGALPVFLASALVLQISAELGFAIERLGIAVGVYFLAGGATSVLMGRLSEHLGPANALRLGGVASSLCLLSVAAARDFTTLNACLGFGGVCNALCQPAANLYVTRTIPASRRALALALKQSAIPAATLVGGLAVPLVALTIGWRWSFVICAAVAAATAALVPSVAADAASSAGDSDERAPLGAMLLLAITIGLGAAGAGCLASFSIAGAARIGMADASAGWLVAFGSGLAIATRISLGYHADYRRSGHLFAVGTLLLLGALGSLGLLSQSVSVFALAVPFVFAAGWGWPGLFNFAVIKNNPAAPGAATGFTQTGTYLGAALGPMLFGLTADRYSWSLAWGLVSVFFLAASLCTMIARARLRSWKAIDVSL